MAKTTAMTAATTVKSGNGKVVAIQKVAEKGAPKSADSADRAFDPAAMDAAAQEALKTFKKLPVETQRVFAGFWGMYFTSAGHKRLGRMLVKANKEFTGSSK